MALLCGTKMRPKKLSALVYAVRVQPRVAHGVMIDKNLKAKELCIVGTKKDSFNEY